MKYQIRQNRKGEIALVRRYKTSGVPYEIKEFYCYPAGIWDSQEHWYPRSMYSLLELAIDYQGPHQYTVLLEREEDETTK